MRNPVLHRKLQLNTFTVENAVGELIRVEIPDGCNTGTIISLKEQGLYNRKTKRYGNLRIFVRVLIPSLENEQDINEFIKRLKND